MLVFVGAIAALSVTMPVLAQEHQASDPKGFVSASGGFVSALGDKTSDFRFEGGARIAPHLMVGNVGRLAICRPTCSRRSMRPRRRSRPTMCRRLGYGDRPGGGHASTGLRAVPDPRPRESWRGRLRSTNPSAQFTFANGVLHGSPCPPGRGRDIQRLKTSGAFVQPPASTQLLFTTGGGAQIAMGLRLAFDAGNRYMHQLATATLDVVLNANGSVFVVWYRFCIACARATSVVLGNDQSNRTSSGARAR